MHAITDPVIQTIINCMKDDGQPQAAISAFVSLYTQLANPESGMISEETIEPASDISKLEDLGQPQRQAVSRALSKTVVIKLNGGLGTSMGLQGPKSLLPVKGNLCFLDIIAKQILHLRKAYGVPIPLLLMNSFSTREASLERLNTYSDLKLEGLPLDFVQHRVPKLRTDTWEPIKWPADPKLEWCPPGHGDLYAAILSSGVLHKLLERGYLYAFISNADNLGATLDETILDYFAGHDLPFLMEVTPRTPADRKGGHLARRKEDRRLILREAAQCPKCDLNHFQDIAKYCFFNTNNLWVNLQALSKMLAERGYVPLPLIKNEKTVDPCNQKTPRVFQLESAMGAAIETFPGAGAISVPRSRFAPVKQCVDLLSIWSDAYELGEDMRITLHPQRKGRPPLVSLDPQYFRLVCDLQSRFPKGAPSLLECESLTVEGDVTFGAGVKVRGCVRIVCTPGETITIKDGTMLEG